MKLWGGRFQKETDNLVNDFNASIQFDQRLYKEDITGSMAHAKMLGACGIISMEDVGAILEAAGIGFENVIKTTCFLADMGDFAQFNSVYEQFFVSKPARSCVAVKDLPKGVLCEIEAIAVK